MNWHAFHENRTCLNCDSLNVAPSLQTNKAGQKLHVSVFWPTHVEANNNARPCVVYCHSNTGSRRASEEAVYLLLSLGVAVAAVDFAVRHELLMECHKCCFAALDS
jgi:hypothetical protein